MKNHNIVLSITFLILLFEVFGLVLIFGFNLIDDFYKRFWIILGMIWVFFFPIALYTCYYHISKEDKRGIIFDKVLSGFATDNIVAIVGIPLLVSPLFLLDYMFLVKEDYRRYRWNKVMNSNTLVRENEV